MHPLHRPSASALGARPGAMRRPWILAMPAAAWIGIALLTGLWPDQPGTDWDYTGDLAAAFGALGGGRARARPRPRARPAGDRVGPPRAPPPRLRPPGGGGRIGKNPQWGPRRR